MKKVFNLSVTLILLSIILRAQSTDPELDYIKKTYLSDKKSLVEHYMNLDSQESVKFWPLYRSFESSRAKLAQERFNVINDYVNNASKLTPELTDNLAKAALNNSISLEKLNLDNYDKMKKVIGPIKAAQYMQLETYLQVTWRVVMQDYIPLIGSLEKRKQN